MNIISEFPIINSVFNKTQNGFIFDLEFTQFVLHKSGFSQLINYTENSYNKFVDLINQNNDLKYFHIYDASDNLINKISENKKFTLKIRERIILEFRSKIKIQNVKNKKIDFIKCENASIDLLNSFPLELFSKFWNNEIDFRKYSKGIVVLFDNRPASICYSAANDFRSEIDIFTFEDFRGLGLGKYAVSFFVNECLNSNLLPNWDCFVENKPSLNIALKTGFIIKKIYNFISIYKK